MKRFLVLLVTITIALLFAQTEISRAEIKPIYLSPRPQATLVMAKTAITIRFGEDVEADSLTNELLQVSGSQSGDHAGTAVLAKDQRTVIFKPDEPFTPAETVSVQLNPGLLSTSGSGLFMESYDFTVSPKADKEPTTPFTPIPGDALGIRPMANILAMIRKASNSYVTVPPSFPKIAVTVPANGTADGYIFLSNFTFKFSNQDVSMSMPYLLILDNEGEPVFYRSMREGRPTMDFKKQPNGLLTYGEWGGIFYGLDSSYNIVKTYQAGNGYTTDIHDLQIIEDDHVLLMIYDIQPVDMTQYGGKANAMVTGLVVQELDDEGQVVFQWRSWDHIDFEDSTADLTRAAIDYVHGNAVELDFDGNLLISSRALDEISKIDRQTGEIIWRLGGKANEFTFVGDPEPFFHQHDIRRLPNGNITIFDNRSGPDSEFARTVEYKLDEVNKIATLVWEYRNENMSPAMGNAQRLPNNNTMIGWGAVYPTLNEVKSNGEIALEMSFVPPTEPGLLRNSYRAFRFEWEGRPETKPLLVARNDIPGVTTLYTSWNGATNISGYLVYASATLNGLDLLTAQEKDGFETKILIADAAEKWCYFQVVPVDEDGKLTQASNLAMAEHCIESQIYAPVHMVTGGQ